MKAYLGNETAMSRAIKALLVNGAATVTSILVSKFRSKLRRKKPSSGVKRRRRENVPQCRRASLVKGGGRHG